MNEPTPIVVTGDGVSTTTLWAVVRNAIRHLIEADDHFKRDRHASALASAVLSIEEAGKAITCMALGKDIVGRNRHALHQLPFLALITVLMRMPSESKWQSILKDGLAPDAELSAEIKQAAVEHPEFATFIADLRAGKLSDKRERVNAWAQARLAESNREGTLDEWQKPILDGVLHNLRLKATYVDIGKHGEVISGPSMIDKDLAESVCVGALSFLLLTAAYPRLADHRDEINELLREDLTGMKAILDVVQRLVIKPAVGAETSR
jgi:hypothetical protein